MDFERLSLPVLKEEDKFDSIKNNLNNEMNNLLSFLQENYNLVTLSIETNYAGISDAAGKRIEYIDFVKKEYLNYFSQVVTKINDEAESKNLIKLIHQFDYLFQIHDSINDIYKTKKVISEQFVELKSDVLLLTRELSSRTLGLFDDLRKNMAGDTMIDVQSLSKEMQESLDDANRQLLSLLADPARNDAGALTNFVTYSQRLKDKLINYANTNNQ